jgi:hypothetical protein
MLASNDKETAVSLMLRTLLRTFVRIPVHLYLNSIHCVVITQHSVTQLRSYTSTHPFSLPKMSCEVASSPFADPGFASPFNVDNAQGDKPDYAALGDFNYSFGPPDNSCVNPQTLSNAGSPSAHFDLTLTSDFTPDNYPPDFNGTLAAPYFQSVEQPFGAPTFPLHLQNQHLHRRSVSEPPDGALLHHHQHQNHPSHPNAPVTFHRDGQLLHITRGSTRPPSKRTKQPRSQPYQRSPRQPPPIQSRYQLRRTHTQPTHLPTTSVPHGLPVNHPQQQMVPVLHHVPFEQLPHEPQYVSSRVCTPAPEAIDPFLGASTQTPAVAHMGGHARGAFEGHGSNAPVAESVVIRMGVEELRSLIMEVVQKAVGGLQGEGSIADVGAISQEQVNEAVGSVQADQSPAGVGEVIEGGGDEVLVAMAGSTDDVVHAKPDAGL